MDIERVIHLHRRAAFAATWSEIQRDLKDGPDAAIERLLTGHSQLKQSDDFTKMAGNIGDAAMASNSPGRLRAWWFYHMLNTTDPLGERLTLMWHSHFATSNRKVKNLIWMREQNEILREIGRGPFGTLLSSVVKHPAMLKWLDADANRKGHPNENLARELLELFTLGIGNYTEADVLDSARALTGWMIKDDKFANRTSRHDEGELTVLGKTQKMNGDDLLSLTLEHPATAKRIAWRLCDHFMGEKSYGDDAISELAKGLVKNDFDINWAVATILRSNLFFADQKSANTYYWTVRTYCRGRSGARTHRSLAQHDAAGGLGLTDGSRSFLSAKRQRLDRRTRLDKFAHGNCKSQFRCGAGEWKTLAIPRHLIRWNLPWQLCLSGTKWIHRTTQNVNGWRLWCAAKSKMACWR